MEVPLLTLQASGSEVNDIISDSRNTGEVGTDTANGNTGEVGTDTANGNTGEVGTILLMAIQAKLYDTANGNTGEVGT